MSWSLEKLGPHIARALQIPPGQLRESFRPGRPDEIGAILALRRDVYPSGVWWDDEQFVKWRYFRPGRMSDFWVFEKDGRFLAGLGIEPIELVVDGQAHPAVRSLDIMVHPAHEGVGLGALINFLLFTHHPNSLVMGSNSRSHSLISKMFTRVLDLGSWKLLVKSGDVLKRRLGLGAAAAPAAGVADAVLATQRWLRTRHHGDGLRVAVLDRFDDRVTGLTRMAEDDGRIIVRRTADYLNWRFVENPRVDYRVYGAFAGDALVAYVVTRYNLRRPNPERAAEIVDWQSISTGAGKDASTDAPLEAAFATAIADLVAAGAHMIGVSASIDAAGDVLRRAGFVHRPDEHLPFFAHVESPPLATRAYAANGWHLTACDSDVE